MDDLSSVIDSATGALQVPAPIRNNNPGALMKGGKLMSFNSMDEGRAALDSNLQNYAKQGVNTLAGVISKWAPPNENDTQAYINDAAKTTGIDPNAKINLSDPRVRQLIGNAITKHENGPKYAEKAQSTVGFDASVIDDAIANAQPEKSQEQPKQEQNAINKPHGFSFDETPVSTLASLTSGIGANIIGGWRGISELVQGNGLDAAAKATQEEIQNRTYQPEAGTTAAKIGEALASPYNPLNYPAEAGKYIGGKIVESGSSPLAATAADVAANLAPSLLIPEARGIVNKINPVAIAKEDIAARTPQVETTAQPQIAQQQAQTIPQQVKPMSVADQFTAKVSDKAAQVQEAAKAAAPEESAVPNFAQATAEKGTALPIETQKARSDVLARVGIPPQDQRVSALAGDAVSANDELQAAKANNPLGELIKQKLDAERSALTNHAENLVQKTGGQIGMDEATLETRGQNIASAFDALKDYFKKATNALYDEADKQAGGVPSVNLSKTEDFLSRDDEFMGKAENGALRTGIQAYMKRMGMIDPETGSLNQITAKQAEGLRQYINSQWSPATSGLAGRIKSAIDDDVFSSAGGEIYQQARQMYAMKKATLDNPSGISKIMDYDPQTPINRTTPYNKIPDKITSLPPEQFKHVISVLDNMPAELQPLADAAKAEIKSQMANKLLETGSKTQTQWNAPGVNTLFKNNTSKYPMVFNPDELASIKDLKDAGDILFIKGGYPGAGIQSHNLLNAGLMTVPSAGVATGEAVGTMMGLPGVGAIVGGLGAKKIAERIGTRLNIGAAKKRFGTTNIKDFPK